jgi:hypothetical protein
MNISLSDRVRLSSEALIRDFDGESVILNLTDESYYGLDHIGTAIWKALIESDSLGDALSRLLVEFDVEEKKLTHDLLKLTGELSEKGILEVTEAKTQEA